MSFSITAKESTPEVGIYTLRGNPVSTLAIFCATLISKQKIKLLNIPKSEPISLMLNALIQAGSSVQLNNHTFVLDSRAPLPSGFENLLFELDELLLFLLPTILGITGQLSLDIALYLKNENSLPPLSAITAILTKFGAEFSVTSDRVTGWVQQMQPADINLQQLLINDFPSETDILNLTIVSMLAATNVKSGRSTIHIQMQHPVIEELLDFLKIVGYNIRQENNTISIEFGKTAKSASFKFAIDPSSALAYICASVYLNSPLVLRNVACRSIENQLKEEIYLMERIGIDILCRQGSLYLPISEPKSLNAIDIDLSQFHIPSRHLPFIALLLNKSNGCSYIKNWPTNTVDIMELTKLGLRYEIDQSTLRINPIKPYISKQIIHCYEPNFAIACMIASLSIEGTTTIITTANATSLCQQMHKQLTEAGVNSQWNIL